MLNVNNHTLKNKTTILHSSNIHVQPPGAGNDCQRGWKKSNATLETYSMRKPFRLSRPLKRLKRRVGEGFETEKGCRLKHPLAEYSSSAYTGIKVVKTCCPDFRP